jgi:hypothetical protein
MQRANRLVVLFVVLIEDFRLLESGFEDKFEDIVILATVSFKEL